MPNRDSAAGPFTLEQVRAMKSQTDWARLDAMTEEEIQRAAESDPDNPPLTDEDLALGRIVPVENPFKKIHVSMRLSPEVVEFFKEPGPGYQSRIDDVLRQYVRLKRRERQQAAQPAGQG